MNDREQQLKRMIELVTQMQLADPTPEQSNELQGLLADPAVQQIYIELMSLHEHLGTAFAPGLSDVGHDVDEMDRFILALSQVEASGKDVISIPADPAPNQQSQNDQDPGKLSARDMVAVGGYLLRKAALSRPALVAYAAAVALLAAVLIIPWGQTPQELTDNTPGEQSQPAPVLPDTTPAVATPVAQLTAEYDAVWDRRPGQDLYAGQRFTLNQGYAEITTRDGAVAILEAPCTIELVNDNALRLHAGKLVGLCHVASSKGFVVMTELADIVDLGTEFGVAVEGQGRETRVQVYRGIVRVTDMNANAGAGADQTLHADQAVTVSADKGVLAADFDQNLFERDISLAGLRPESLSGAALWVGWVPADLNGGRQQSDSLQVFVERSGVDLNQDMAVDTTRAGLVTIQDATGGVVASGERVDVYLMHFNPIDTGNGDVVRIFEVRFDRPILGVIIRNESLAQTDGLLGAATTLYPDLPNIGRGGSGLDHGDSVHISEDHKTIVIRLKTEGYIEQIRVLVRGDGPN